MATDPWLFATMRTLLKRVHALEATLQTKKIQLSLADCISYPNFEIAEQSEKGNGDTYGELKLGFQWNPSAPEFHCAPETDAGAHLVEAAVRAEGLLRESQDSHRSEMPAEMFAEKVHVSFAKEIDDGALKAYHATEEALLQDILRAEALLRDFRTSGEVELGAEISFEYWKFETTVYVTLEDPHTSTRARDDDEDSDYNDDSEDSDNHYELSEEDLARFWGQEHTSTRARVDDEDSDYDDDSEDSDNHCELSAEDWAKFWGQ